MHLYIDYNKNIDDNLIKLWFNHYNELKIQFGIYVEKDDINYFKEKYSFIIDNIITTIPKNIVKITEKDFLFSYSKTNDDIMLLSYNVNESFFNELENESICIGRLFQVPIKNKLMYSTFEIPDFILYQHKNHTNYTIDGLKIRGGKKISNSIVCLNMNPSKVSNDFEYYETNILIYKYIINEKRELTNPYFFIVYLKYSMNIFVNKEKQYGIIWIPKCGCTTITNIFCEINNIFLEKEESKRSLLFYRPQYRYNQYLQNIDLIGFIRNPYERFLSSFLDKNIIKSDSIYLQLHGFLDYKKKYEKNSISNLLDYLSKNGYISNHYQPISNYNREIPYYKDLEYKIYKIEENMNENLYFFLQKYHHTLEKKDILQKCDNSICKQNNTKNKMNNFKIFHFQYFNEFEWESYLEKNIIDYKLIIESDIDLKNKIYTLFKSDFIKYNYSFDL